MKLKVLLLFFLFFTIVNYSQNENDKIVYFDSTYQQNIKIGNSFYSTSVDNETKNMGNYRIIKDYNIQQKKYTIIDYYKSGKTKAKGTTLNKNTICIHDELIQYYENGNKKISTNYFGGIKLGKEYEWYENGNIKTKKNFIATEDQFKTTCIIDAFWDKMGNEKVKNGKGYYEEERKDYYSEGGIKEGLKDGLWKGWVGNVENKFSEFYIKGILKSGVIKTENNIESKYYEIENYAVPKKGHKHFYNFIKEKVQLPSDNYKGIYLEFTINTEGKIVNPKILKSVNKELDAKNIETILDYGNWIPKTHRGQNVLQTIKVPFLHLKQPIR